MMVVQENVVGELFALAYILATLVCAVHILLHKDDSRAAALWLLTVFTLPAVGMVLYLAFGVNRVRRKTLLKEAGNLRLRQEYMAYLPRSRAAYEYPDEERDDFSVAEFPWVLDRFCERPLLVGNRIKLMLQGDQVYQSMLDAIEHARSSVNLQTYIFVADRVGRQFVEAMVRKAREGVECRLLYDPVGSIDSLRFLDELGHTGVAVHPFTPLNPLKRRWQINLRNHRKLLLVDGKVGFTGGMNVSEKHLVDHPLLTRVKDYHFMLEGPIVHQMQESFVEDWYYACGEKLISEKFFPPLEWRGDDLARVVTSGPDGDHEAFYQVLFAAIVGARSRLWIVSPYLIPDTGILSALRLAAQRGVAVRLLVPQRSDHPMVSLAARTYYEELLSYGVRIYERKPPFLHAKAVVVDDMWAIFGSANMDVRSFRLNFEANVEVRSRSFVRALSVAIEDDMRNALPVYLPTFRERSPAVKVVERACGLLSPLL